MILFARHERERTLLFLSDLRRGPREGEQSERWKALHVKGAGINFLNFVKDNDSATPTPSHVLHNANINPSVDLSHSLREREREKREGEGGQTSVRPPAKNASEVSEYSSPRRTR
jgi:hypothetical protein